MPYPTISDDGRTVELDLHGATVSQGMSLVANTIRMAINRGRSTVRIVHGSSTSDTDQFAATLKHKLHDAFGSGRFGGTVNHLFSDTYIIVSLPGGSSDHHKISIFDIDR